MSRHFIVVFAFVNIILPQISLAIEWREVTPMQFVSVSSSLAEISSEDKKNDIAGEIKSKFILDLETPDPQGDNASQSIVNMATDRIFGGNVASQVCFPYQVGLLLQRPRGLYWCGGSLISDEYVLTAAHCVDMATRALIFLGAHEIKNAKEIGQVRLMVNRSNFIVFPTWNPRRLKDDIALVRLPLPIEFNDRIHPIKLPKRSYEYRHFKDKLAIASGWGRYATGIHAISGVLRFVNLRIVDGGTCKHSFPLSYRSTNICTSGKYERSTCNGDSGGPLVLQRKRSKERVLVGITSFGSRFGCDRGHPAAFTKVASYLDWISDEAGVDPYHENSDAEIFRRQVKSIETSHCFQQNADDIVDGDSEDNEDQTARILHEHIQRYPDGTFLRTSFYNG